MRSRLIERMDAGDVVRVRGGAAAKHMRFCRVPPGKTRAVTYAYTTVRCPVVACLYNQAYYSLRLGRPLVEPEYHPCQSGTRGRHVGQKPPRDLVDLMKALRKRSGLSIGDVERTMKIPKDTYRHIERRRRPLPTVDRGLIEFVRSYLACVGATPEDETEAFQLATHTVVEQFADWMQALRDRGVNLDG